MPRSLFPAFLGGTVSLAPWWPFAPVLHVAEHGGIAGSGRGTHGLVPVSPPSWSLRVSPFGKFLEQRHSSADPVAGPAVFSWMPLV